VATLPALGPGTAVALSTAQTGSADSTNVADRGDRRGPGAIVLTTTVGATPTVTINIQGSVDGTNFYNIPYQLVATSETIAIAAIVVTTAVTTTYLLRHDHAWRFLKLVYSANTNVTSTATAYI
jgi:hypothetical protein